MAALAPERPAERRASGGRSRRVPARAALRVAQGFLATAIGLAAVAPAALWLRLREGPIDLAPFVGRVEAAAGEALGGARVTIEGAALTLGEAGDPRPGVRLTGVRAVDAAGAALFSAPAARVEFRPLDLLAGRLRPTAVTIVGAEATLRRDATGRFRFGVVAPAATADDAEDPALGAGAAAAAALDAGEGAVGALRAIDLVDARLTYRDAVSGRVWRAEGATLRVTRDAGGIAAEASLTLPQGAHGETRLAARGSRLPDGGASMRLTFADASPRDLADQFAALDAFRALDAPLSGEARVAIDGAGKLLGFRGRIEAGAGALVAPDRSVALEGGTFDVALDPETGRYGLERVALRTAMGAISGAGFLDVTRGPDGAPTGAVAQIELDGLAVTDPALVAGPVAFDGGRVVGRATLDPFVIEIGEAHLARGALRLDARGRAALGPEGWRGEAAIAGRDAAVADVIALWPTPAAPGARRWIERNLEAGTVERLDAFLRVAPDDVAVDLTFAFRDATAHYFRPLPPIRGGRGWAQLDGRTFALTLAEGAVTAPGGGVVDLAGSSVAITGIDRPRPEVEVAEVAAVGAGPVGAILEVVDIPPLGFPSRLGIDPAEVAGAARARATLRLPLLRDLRLDAVEAAVEATVEEAGLSLPALPRRFTAPSLALRVDTEGFAASGTGRFGDDPVTLSWTETFDPARGAPASRIEAEAAVTPALAADFGVAVGAAFDGRAPARATIERFEDGAIAFDATADLTPAALSVPALGWRKDARWKGEGAAKGRLGADGALTLERFSIAAPGLEAEGRATLGPDGALRRLALGRFRFLETTDAALEVEATGDGFAVTARGAAFDLTAFEGSGEGEPGAGPRLAATIDVGRLVVDDGLALAPARGRATGGGGRGYEGRIEGRVGGRAAVKATLAAEGAATRARIAAADAGALLREAGYFAGGYGGRLAADALVPPGEGARIEGSARIEGMRVVRDPALQTLLASADLAEAERLLRDEGIAFDRVEARFATEPGRVELEDVVAVGPLIGLTAAGSIDTARDRIAMDGVFTPLYAVNSLLGNLPIIGGLLTGGEGEGLFGFTFTLSGPASDPEATVNPLSILAPGVLRKLFGPSEGRVSPPAGRDRPND